MSERFERWNDHSCKVKDNQEDTLLNWEDVVDLLNEQQATIGEQKIAIDELITSNGIQKDYSSAVCYCWLIFDNKNPTDDTKLIWLI